MTIDGANAFKAIGAHEKRELAVPTQVKACARKSCPTAHQNKNKKTKIKTKSI